MENALDQTTQIIEAGEKFLVLAHVNPDGDALGSAWALTLALRQMGKDVVAYHSDNPNYRHLDAEWQASPPIDARERTALILDTNTPTRVAYSGDLRLCQQQIVIDHHITNSYFADVNVVDPQAAATAQILPKLFDRLGVEIDIEIAKALYVALFTDSGRFMLDTVSEATLMVRDRLRNILGDWREFERQLTDYPRGWLRYGDLALQEAKVLEGEVVASILSNEYLLSSQVPDGEILDAGAIALERLREIPATLYVFLYQRMDGCYYASLRCYTGEIDTSVIALQMGGGGHVGAAGFTLQQEPGEVLQALLTAYRHERG